MKMDTFEQFNLTKQLYKAIEDLKFVTPTPIQQKTFKVIRSGKNVVGIAQTGTGKTLAYMLPIIQDMKYSPQSPPKVIIMVPTRELVLQMVNNAKDLTKYMNIRVLGVYGGTNINTQKIAVHEGCDILVATPGRLYDLLLCGVLKSTLVKKLVIDEVDVMLDLGFRYQLKNIFELLPQKRQNIMFSATMTHEVDSFIKEFFILPEKIAIAVSGTPLDNIQQTCYPVHNYYTKVNLLKHLLLNKEVFNKVLVFVSEKKIADRLFEALHEVFGKAICVIHSNKSQNYRIRSVKQFDEGATRVIVATDVMARGLDLDKVSHVINFDTPDFPENYMHRIGRTGRAEEKGNSILFYTEKEEADKIAIEILMDMEIPVTPFPEEVEIEHQLAPEERPKMREVAAQRQKKRKDKSPDTAFHEKKKKNKKVNMGGSHHLKKANKYKKPQTRGDKNANRRKKK